MIIFFFISVIFIFLLYIKTKVEHKIKNKKHYPIILNKHKFF